MLVLSALLPSANAYEVTRLSLEGIGLTQVSTRFSLTGTFFGGVIGEPIVHSRALRLGFSYTRPVAWTPGGIEGSGTLASLSGPELIGFSSSGSFTTSLFGLAAGIQVTERLRRHRGRTMGCGALIGITASWGTAADRPVGPTLGGNQALTRVAVRTANLLYSLSYEF